MRAFTLVTHAPVTQDAAKKAAWSKAIEQASDQVGVYVWHNGVIDQSGLTGQTNIKALHHQIKSPLWHEQVFRQHWAGLNEATCQHRLIHLQAMGLVHDAHLNNPFDSHCFVWLSPEWLSWLGPLAGDLIGDLKRLIRQTDRCIYARTRSVGRSHPLSEHTHPIDALIAPQKRLSQLNAHYWHHFGDGVEHNQPPSPQGLLAKASVDLEGTIGWVALDADGHPAHWLDLCHDSTLHCYQHQVLRRG